MPTFGNHINASQANNTSNEVLTPEAQVIMMEAQRAEWLDKGNSAAIIIPPTPLTHLVIGDSNGADNTPATPLLPGQ